MDDPIEANPWGDPSRGGSTLSLDQNVWETADVETPVEATAADGEIEFDAIPPSITAENIDADTEPELEPEQNNEVSVEDTIAEEEDSDESFDEFDDFQRVEIPPYKPKANVEEVLSQIYQRKIGTQKEHEHILDVASSRAKYNLLVSHTRQYEFDKPALNFRLKNTWRNTTIHADMMKIVNDWNEVENGLSSGAETNRNGWKLFNWSTGPEKETEDASTPVKRKSVNRHLLKIAGERALALKNERLEQERLVKEKMIRDKAERARRLELERSKKLENAKKYEVPKEIAQPKKKTFFNKLFGKKQTGISSEDVSPEPSSMSTEQLPLQERLDRVVFESDNEYEEDDEDDDDFEFGYNQLGDTEDAEQENTLEDVFEEPEFDEQPENSVAPIQPAKHVVLQDSTDDFENSKSSPHEHEPKLAVEDDNESDDFEDFEKAPPAPSPASAFPIKPIMAQPMQPMKRTSSAPPVSLTSTVLDEESDDDFDDFKSSTPPTAVQATGIVKTQTSPEDESDDDFDDFKSSTTAPVFHVMQPMKPISANASNPVIQHETTKPQPNTGSDLLIDL